MGLNISESELKQRFDTLLKRVQHIAAANTAKHVGKVYEALIETKDEQLEGYVTGRLSNNMIVHLKGEESMIGSIIKVSLDESKGFYYMGHAI